MKIRNSVFSLGLVVIVLVGWIPGYLCGCATLTTTTAPDGTVTVIESELDVAAVLEILRFGGDAVPDVAAWYLQYEALRHAQDFQGRLDDLAVLQAKIEAAIALFRSVQETDVELTIEGDEISGGIIISGHTFECSTTRGEEE